MRITIRIIGSEIQLVSTNLNQNDPLICMYNSRNWYSCRGRIEFKFGIKLRNRVLIVVTVLPNGGDQNIKQPFRYSRGRVHPQN